MKTPTLLEDVLAEAAGTVGNDVVATLRQIATASVAFSYVIANGVRSFGANQGEDRLAYHHPCQALGARANEVFIEAMKSAPVAIVASEKAETTLVLDRGAPLAVTFDPLDGSSNVDTNVSVGTIFGLLPAAGPRANGSTLDAAILQPGSAQLAAGFAIYGPQTCLVLTFGSGTHIFTLDRRISRFVLVTANVQIPEAQAEYAINASNYRHWDEAVRTYVDDLISGADGPRGKDFNMRWIASLVAEAFRILRRGGVFLYPADRRPGYESGRLRLVFEANPLAMVMEQAGGAATDGLNRILDLTPSTLMQRVPLVFGSRDKVARVSRHHATPPSTSERSPLFARRGFFYHP